MPEKTKWTILTYIAAHNDLWAYGMQSRQEIFDVGSTPEVVHGVLFDYQGGAARYVMGESGVAVECQELLGTFDSGDPEGIVAMATWLFSKHPAERYGVILWSHGTGWEASEIQAITAEVHPGEIINSREQRRGVHAPGSTTLFRTTLHQMLRPPTTAERAILFDDGTGHSLDTIELAKVVNKIAGSIGQPIDILGMDACLMANIEVAYEIRDAVRYLVASEETVPANSWPYREIFGELRDKPDLNGEDLARLIVRDYVSFYEKNAPVGGEVTKVALDLGELESVIDPLSRLAAQLRDEMTECGDALWVAQAETRVKETHQRPGEKEVHNKFDYFLWDIGSVAFVLSKSSKASQGIQRTATDTVQALMPGKGVVLADGHLGNWLDGIRGVSIYLTRPRYRRIAPQYGNLAFAKNTPWLQMLHAYHDQFE